MSTDTTAATPRRSVMMPWGKSPADRLTFAFMLALLVPPAALAIWYPITALQTQAWFDSVPNLQALYAQEAGDYNSALEKALIEEGPRGTIFLYASITLFAMLLSLGAVVLANIPLARARHNRALQHTAWALIAIIVVGYAALFAQWETISFLSDVTE